jgi:glutamate carboxypeptidase
MHAAAFHAYLQARSEAMLARLAELVGHESPSREKGLLDSLALSLAARLERLGATVDRVGNPEGGDHLTARWAAPGPAGALAPVLVLGHFDTVWPQGTLAARPFRVADGRAYGPGVYDMKAGLMLVEFALEAIRARGCALRRPVVVLWTSDEEIGSPRSRGLIEDEARRAALVLVPEPPLEGGRLKTARKGVGRFRLVVKGRPAHAGVEPEKGVSAVVELAHQVLRLHALNDPEAGTSVNVGVVAGGTAENVVPAEAVASIDVRAATAAEAQRVEAAVRAAAPVLAGALVRVEGGFNRPPMPRTPQGAALFEQVRAIGRRIGLELGEGSTGGGSDGNFTAALGVPTLDGLGAIGAGAHAEDEHVVVASLPERAALLAAALLELEPVAKGSRCVDSAP